MTVPENVKPMIFEEKISPDSKTTISSDFTKVQTIPSVVQTTKYVTENYPSIMSNIQLTEVKQTGTTSQVRIVSTPQPNQPSVTIVLSVTGQTVK